MTAAPTIQLVVCESWPPLRRTTKRRLCRAPSGAGAPIRFPRPSLQAIAPGTASRALLAPRPQGPAGHLSPSARPSSRVLTANWRRPGPSLVPGRRRLESCHVPAMEAQPRLNLAQRLGRARCSQASRRLVNTRKPVDHHLRHFALRGRRSVGSH